MVLLQGLCYVVDLTMVFLTFIGIFDFVFHLVELSRGLLLLNLPYRTVPGIYCWRFHVAGFMLFYLRIIFKVVVHGFLRLRYIGSPIPRHQTIAIQPTLSISLLLMGFKLMAGAVASCALIGVAVGVGIIYGSLLISIGRNPSQRDELLQSYRRYIPCWESSIDSFKV